MKSTILFVWSLTLTFGSMAQSIRHFKPEALIQPFDLEITTHKTTVLIFPAPVQSADRGAQYILARKAKGTDNILKIKAGRKDFPQSNLSVITTDGALYSFRVRYTEQPPYQAVDLRDGGTQKQQSAVDFKGQSFNSNQLQKWIQAAHEAPATIKGVVRRKQGLKIRLESIYRKEGLFFFCLSFKNKTELQYTVDTMRFYIRDRKHAKRTATQERKMHPIRLQYYTDGKQTSTVIAVLNAFRLPKTKELVITPITDTNFPNLQLRVRKSKLLRILQLIIQPKQQTGKNIN